MRIKSASDIDKAYKDAIGGVPAKYKSGVATVNDWQEKAVGGQGLYEEQMRNAAVLKRRETGLKAVTTEEWKKAATDKGAARIGAGMTAGAAKRQTNYEPYRAKIESMTLEARTADPEVNVDKRVKPVARELHALKMGR